MCYGCWRLSGGAGGVRCVLLCMLEAVEDVLCLLEALEVMCCALLYMLEAVEGIRCVMVLLEVLLCVPEAVEIVSGWLTVRSL